MLRKYFAIFFARAAWHKNGTGGDKPLHFNVRRLLTNKRVDVAIFSARYALEGLQTLGCKPFLLLLWRWRVAAVCGSFWRVAAEKWHKNGTKRAGLGSRRKQLIPSGVPLFRLLQHIVVHIDNGPAAGFGE